LGLKKIGKKFKKAVKKVAKVHQVVGKDTLKLAKGAVKVVTKTEIGKAAAVGAASFFGTPAAGAYVAGALEANEKIKKYTKSAKEIKGIADSVKAVGRSLKKPQKTIVKAEVKDTALDYAAENKLPIIAIGSIAALYIGSKFLK
jgi:hypothetical protein